ncbi:hypothetical protein ABIB25_001919 [Nakamurella sp. UYEF19]|uniref:class F sortase n=1 Tax=Nakamurella sp. UYEF19 TaxID=1756392 RepID=UPI003399EDF0
MSLIRIGRRVGSGRRAAAPIAVLTVAMFVATACGARSGPVDAAAVPSATVPSAAVASATLSSDDRTTGVLTTTAPISTRPTSSQGPAPTSPITARASPTPTTTSPQPTIPAPTASSTTDRSAPATPPRTGPAPVSIRLPSIGIDEQLIDLGIAADGSAEVPQDYDRAGWFSAGGRPGAVGPTVILGHVDSLDGPAVFYRLRDLAVGDTADIGLADGTVATYRVTKIDQYGKNDFPTFAVYGATLHDVVRFVTCGGPFDREALSYTENVVVTAQRT